MRSRSRPTGAHRTRSNHPIGVLDDDPMTRSGAFDKSATQDSSIQYG